jgi:phosphonatase-like hydrolase
LASPNGPVSLIVFDLGGTTIRDRGEVIAAFTAALHCAHIAFDADDLLEWRGASKREVLAGLVARQGLPALQAEQIYANFSTLLKARFSSAADLAFATAAATFVQLKAAGMRLALNSGFDRDIVDQVLASVDWPANTFDAIVCAGDVAHGRPAPDMIALSMNRTGIDSGDRVAVVGDTRLDLEAGWRAGAAYRIGVLSGANDRATLEQGPYTHIVADCAAVPAICIGER